MVRRVLGYYCAERGGKVSNRQTTVVEFAGGLIR